jgi:hypothetical protein
VLIRRKEDDPLIAGAQALTQNDNRGVWLIPELRVASIDGDLTFEERLHTPAGRTNRMLVCEGSYAWQVLAATDEGRAPGERTASAAASSRKLLHRLGGEMPGLWHEEVAGLRLPNLSLARSARVLERFTCIWGLAKCFTLSEHDTTRRELANA